MVTRNVVLTDAQAALVERLVTSGRYQNASEVPRSGLRLLEEQESDLDDLRARLTAGAAEVGARAPGSGAQAVRRAFSRARAQGA